MTTITMRQAKRCRDGRIAYCVGYGERPTLRNPMPDREAAEALAASNCEGFRVIPVLARIESRKSSQRTGRLAANAKDVLVLTEIVG